jgi:hypothetical protein
MSTQEIYNYRRVDENVITAAFYSLYALKNLGWSVEQAEKFRASIWAGSDVPHWEAFIGEMAAKIMG